MLITGASRGIGAACADAFGRRGAQLALVARTPMARADAFTMQVNLTDSDACSSVILQTLEHYGRIDVLINNAGFGMYGRTEDIAITELDHMFALNLRVPVHLTQLALPHMRARGSGMIVNVSSIAGVIALPWMTAYSASKAALSCFSDGFRRELAGTGIHVMDVLPGYIKTDFQSSAVGQPPPGVLSARKRAITAERCAELLVRGVERDARTIATPRWAWLFIWAQRFAPWAVDSPLVKMNQ